MAVKSAFRLNGEKIDYLPAIRCSVTVIMNYFWMIDFFIIIKLFTRVDQQVVYGFYEIQSTCLLCE